MECRNQSGLIYFLHEPELGRLKIGWSGRDVTTRLRAFQVGNSQDLKLLGVLPGSERDEAALHRRFARFKLPERREWFEATDGMMAEVRTILEANGVTVQ